MMCVKHAPRLNRLRRTALLRSFVANVLWQTSQYSLLFDLISRMTVQIDRTFSLLLETASGFELNPIPRSAGPQRRRQSALHGASERVYADRARGPDQIFARLYKSYIRCSNFVRIAAISSLSFRRCFLSRLRTSSMVGSSPDSML